MPTVSVKNSSSLCPSFANCVAPVLVSTRHLNTVVCATTGDNTNGHVHPGEAGPLFGGGGSGAQGGGAPADASGEAAVPGHLRPASELRPAAAQRLAVVARSGADRRCVGDA